MVHVRLRYNSSKENEYVISLGICKLFVTAKYTAKYTAGTKLGNNSVTSSNSEQLEQQSESKPYKALNDGFIEQRAVLAPLLVNGKEFQETKSLQKKLSQLSSSDLENTNIIPESGGAIYIGSISFSLTSEDIIQQSKFE